MIHSFLWGEVRPEESMPSWILKIYNALNPLGGKSPKLGFSSSPRKKGDESSEWMFTKHALNVRGHILHMSAKQGASPSIAFIPFSAFWLKINFIYRILWLLLVCLPSLFLF
eukprot:TRINITY_DN25108_c0_g1_i1.p1 TRINITY_DN25108_c0_g1~~TRINITY_DN25108_c0_g1_i1.p1  ORF type:complete len:112 (+),score=9.17 TRINITY_DN25108_c0_g1_i1:179-514(+)